MKWIHDKIAYDVVVVVLSTQVSNKSSHYTELLTAVCVCVCAFMIARTRDVAKTIHNLVRAV